MFKIDGINYVPIQAVVTIPRRDDKGLLPPETVNRDAFKRSHYDQIEEFWKDLEKRDASFDRAKAFVSTFTLADKKSEAPPAEPGGSGGQPPVLEDMTVAELKGYAELNNIDLGSAKTKAEILETIQEAQQ